MIGFQFRGWLFSICVGAWGNSPVSSPLGAVQSHRIVHGGGAGESVGKVKTVQCDSAKSLLPNFTRNKSVFAQCATASQKCKKKCEKSRATPLDLPRGVAVKMPAERGPVFMRPSHSAWRHIYRWLPAQSPLWGS
jgi:hypothetical protein